MSEHIAGSQQPVPRGAAVSLDPATHVEGRREDQAEAASHRQRRTRRRVASDLRAPAPPATEHNILTCLWCSSGSAFTARSSGGLLTHITCQHRGEAFDEQHVAQLRFLNKGMCVMCGCLRSRNGRTCPFCQLCTPLRDPKAGDRILDRAMPLGNSGQQMAAEEARQ